jgi:uncharacterized protein (TIGR02145 family)
MAIPPKQIGWSQKSNLLWEISRELDKTLNFMCTGPCPVPPSNTNYNVAGCERMEYHVITYTGNDVLPEGTIVNNDTPECWYVVDQTTNPADVGTITYVWDTPEDCQPCIDSHTPTTTTTTTVCLNCIQTTVEIDGQIWDKCNLNVTTYRNGDTIPEVTDPAVWATLTTGAWCHYNNDPLNEPIYGKLYNWYAVNDPRGLAPIGKHIPTDAEWTTLTDYLGGLTVAGGKMKETGLCHWQTPNTGATNDSGFTALPGGNRINVGAFDDISVASLFWSSTEYNDIFSWYRSLAFTNITVNRNATAKEVGLSVRCLAD